ncbi:hypothetical protein MRX96_032935 [Rhipicephalus microplus]
MPAVSAVSRRNTTVFTSTLVLLTLLIKKSKYASSGSLAVGGFALFSWRVSKKASTTLR